MIRLCQSGSDNRNEADPLAQVYCPTKGAAVIRYLTVVLIILSLILAVATTAVVIADPCFGGEVGVLSLRSTPPASDAPLFMVESSANARYLRGAAGIRYDGMMWELALIEGDGSDLGIEASADDLPLRPVEQAMSYREFERAELNSASCVGGAEYVQVPPSISERVRNLSLEITGGFDTPYEKARAIEVYLKLHYAYDLDFEPAPAGWEPNDWFLFEAKEGICGNFSSAFVVLARASDIPSRLAAGYFVRSGEGQQVIYADQAHAWGEVGFEGLGWVAFDAT